MEFLVLEVPVEIETGGLTGFVVDRPNALRRNRRCTRRASRWGMTKFWQQLPDLGDADCAETAGSGRPKLHGVEPIHHPKHPAGEPVVQSAPGCLPHILPPKEIAARSTSGTDGSKGKRQRIGSNNYGLLK